ncbi:MAG: hypothetical protein GX558_00575, partial [Clostridiales bacterium]|nr:hypothetical protein [Clostridiales bacterium]
HDIFTFDKEVGAFEDARVDPVENGPLRAAIRVRTRHGCSELTQIFSLQAGSRELQVECLLTLSEKHKIVKLAFPIKAGSPRAVYSMPFGFITKACDGREEPAQMWAGVFDEESGAGMALINDAKYSFCAKGGELRMIAGRAAIYADHGSPRGDWAEYQDQGEQRFSYALRPYSQSDPSDVARSAALMNQPVHVVLETHHDGPLDNRYAGIDISAGNVLCQTVKRAEDGGAYIARLYEVAGKSARARVHFAMLGATAELAFGPQEIKTLRIEPDGSWREVLMTEYELGE